MLIEFRVENHRSIRDEQVLSMEAATDKGDKEDLRPRTVKGYKKKLLPVACIYGANASGKSNVLSALAWMKGAVTSSSGKWSPHQGVPREPFAWGSSRTNPSLYEVSFVVDQIRYQYGFVVSDSVFLEEWLYAWPNGKKQAVFRRDLQVFKVSDQLKNGIKFVEMSTRENALFLATATRLNRQTLYPVQRWFVRLTTMHIDPSPHFYYGMPPEEELSFDLQSPSPLDRHEDASLRKERMDEFRNFLKRADLGIIDVRMDYQDPQNSPSSEDIHFSLRHERRSDEAAWLPLGEESKGTQTLFRLGLPVLNTLQRGGVLLADELESSLHPALARYIVDLFNNP